MHLGADRLQALYASQALAFVLIPQVGQQLGQAL